MKRKKYRLKRKIKKQLFVLMSLGVLCVGCVYMIRDTGDQRDVKAENEYIEKKEWTLSTHNNDKQGDIDVLAIGNSDLFSGFNPLQLWHEYGITSYAAGASMQNMALTYYMLEEILQYQQPKVLILELDSFFETRGEDNKAAAIKETYKMTYPLFKYTPKWKELSKQAYTKNLPIDHRTLLRGYYYKTEVKSNDKGYSYMGMNYGEEPMVKYTEQYFSQIMDLAYEKGCVVIFTCFPSRTSWTYRKHNTVKKYAQKYNVPYLDMNVDDYNTGFDWKTDSRDAGNHLNHSGATKITRLFGEYLKKQYHLTDYRGHVHFKDWDKDYDYFMKHQK